MMFPRFLNRFNSVLFLFLLLYRGLSGCMQLTQCGLQSYVITYSSILYWLQNFIFRQIHSTSSIVRQLYKSRHVPIHLPEFLLILRQPSCWCSTLSRHGGHFERVKVCHAPVTAERLMNLHNKPTMPLEVLLICR